MTVREERHVTLRRLIGKFCPSPLRSVLRKVTSAGEAPANSVPEWAVVPEGWAENDTRGEGWLHESIVAANVARWPSFMRTIEGPGPLGVDRETTEISYQNRVTHTLINAFSYVLARAAYHKEEIAVLDWGGGLGNYSKIARAALPEITIRYTVHDLPPFCAAGQKLLPEVRFEADRQVALGKPYDVVFASSSFQYLRDWRSRIAEIAARAQPWLFVTRLALVRSAPSFVVVQRPHAYGYHTEYLSWIFNRAEFIACCGDCGFLLEREFLIDERPIISGAPEQCEERGLLFRRTSR
jgi:putative methyltransferase (TIGR04325 family)